MDLQKLAPLRRRHCAEHWVWLPLLCSPGIPIGFEDFELCRDSLRLARERTLRPRARRFYRSDRTKDWPFRVGRQRNSFLDEIGDIPLALQPKLLRVLQEQEFERLGSGRTHRVDVRLVAATHQNLERMAKRGEFRSDLYYRLNVFPVTLPPLRDRREDIAPLVEHYVELFCHRMGKSIDTIPEEFVEACKAYAWPGNIRELQNVIERAVILSSGDSLPNLLRPTRGPVLVAFPPSTTLKESERILILGALEATGWLVGGPYGAAARLEMRRTTLIARMKKHGIFRPAENSNIDDTCYNGFPAAERR